MNGTEMVKSGGVGSHLMRPAQAMSASELARAQAQGELYREALILAGLRPKMAVRYLGVLTTDLCGEVVEVAMVDVQANGESRVYTSRVRPQSPVSPEAAQVHGLTTADLQNYETMDQLAPRLLDRIMAPDAQGYSVPLVAWSGNFIHDALRMSAAVAWPDILSIQSLVIGAELAQGRSVRYPPSLEAMRWTVEIPRQDPRRARSSAEITRQLVQKLLASDYATIAPEIIRKSKPKA